MRILFIIALSIAVNLGLWAQDFHFSQIENNQCLINPALAGVRMGPESGTRIQLDTRAQIGNYTAKTDAYKTVVAAVDWTTNAKYAFSGVLSDNRSATNGFNDFNAIGGVSYDLIHQQNNYKSKNVLRVGLQLGIRNRQVNPANFTYDEQYAVYEADGFDRSLPSGEQFVRTSYTKANLNFGVQYLRSSRNNNNTVFGGFALYSLNRPNESLYKVYKGLPMRVTTNLGLRLKLNDDILLQPSLLYMYQSKAKELLTSLLVTSRMENTDVVLLYGLSYRAKDAIIFQLGFTKKSLTCRLSYDLITNYSKLYRNNSFELGFTYFILDSKTSSIENVKAPM